MTAAPHLPESFTLLPLGEVASTNDEARRLAEAGAAAGTVAWAERQTAGRGRRGRAWDSPAGNSYASLLLRPACPPAMAAQLSFVAALAVAEAVAALLPIGRRVVCKWPNDVLVDGAKCAGILLESRMGAGGMVDWLIVGVGVNLRHAPALSDYPATSLAAAGAEVAPDQMLEAWLGRFAHWSARWRRGGFAPVRAAWLLRADGLGRAIRVRLQDAILDGVFETLDEDGALVLSGADGSRRRITAGDVFRAA